MHKQILLAALVCNVFSLSAMDEEKSCSPKERGEKKWEKELLGKKKDAARKANRTKKYDRYNSGNLEEQSIVEEATRTTLKSSKEWLELAKKNSDDSLKELVEKQ